MLFNLLQSIFNNSNILYHLFSTNLHFEILLLIRLEDVPQIIFFHIQLTNGCFRVFTQSEKNNLWVSSRKLIKSFFYYKNDKKLIFCWNTVVETFIMNSTTVRRAFCVIFVTSLDTIEIIIITV